MCKVCGCGDGEVRVDGKIHESPHSHDHDLGHEAHIHHEHDGDMHFGHGPAGTHVGGVSQSNLLKIEENILSKNDGFAQANRDRLDVLGAVALNLVSSPGAGKTTLLVETLNRLKQDFDMCVIEGDQESANDADRIRATGVRAVQINTGRGCHLDAHMVGHAMDELDPPGNSIVFIENIGNLVCPSGFDLGEASKVVILSVAEGDDKPIKYPDAFAAADLMLISKTDLLPHVDFDVSACIEHARCINPDIEVIELSAKTGEGVDQWVGWVAGRRRERLESEQQDLQSRLSKIAAAIDANDELQRRHDA